MRLKKNPKNHFNTLVMQEVQEPIKNHFMTPEKITGLEMTQNSSRKKKKKGLFQKYVS